MSAGIVLQQMIMIFMMVLIGYFLYTHSQLDEPSSKKLSGIVTNVCNPAVLLNAALSNTTEIEMRDFWLGILVPFLLYIMLIGISFVVPRLLRVKKEDYFAYEMMTVYANTGFIGIPIVSAVMAPDALFYVTLNNIMYSIFFYTHGSLLAERQMQGSKEKEKKSFFKSFVNVGTVSGMIALALYLLPVELPMMLEETTHYIGRATTFLSMLVIGVSLGKMGIKNIFTGEKTLYLFTLLRLLGISIGLVCLMKLCIHHELLVGANAFMLAVPAGSLPLMLAQKNEMETTTLSRGIILSTMFSVITIPIVTLFL